MTRDEKIDFIITVANIIEDIDDKGQYHLLTKLNNMPDSELDGEVEFYDHLLDK